MKVASAGYTLTLVSASRERERGGRERGIAGAKSIRETFAEALKTRHGLISL